VCIVDDEFLCGTGGQSRSGALTCQCEEYSDEASYFPAQKSSASSTISLARK
jgi:hypothetical protein